LIVKNSLVTAMEFSRCARTRVRPTENNRATSTRSLKTQQRSSRSTLF